MTNKYIEEFIKLVKITAERDKIKTHPESYYRKMFETVPGGILKFYVAEYEGKVIAANIVIFYGDTATYLHGASDNEYRNVMAPYLLQWQAILDAKKAGYQKYDLGGIKSCITQHEICNNRWAGITRFKLGFAPNVEPTRFPGSYDIILNPKKYYLYRFLQKIKKIL
jgi:lipid II:glycine glycyltransferase (peptidoglycan interpeptide bridge formation enzyme)